RRNDPKPRPMRRARHVGSGEALLDFGHAFVQRRGMLHGPALNRRPRADLASTLPRGEVGVGFLVAHLLGEPFDANLGLEQLPVKAERRPLRPEELATLAAFEV